jgi:biopolymer transport protein ExbD
MNKTAKTLLIVFVVLIIAMIGIFTEVYLPSITNAKQETTSIHNLFLDVNNDGQPDLIVSGQVILNKGNSQSFLSQPPAQ